MIMVDFFFLISGGFPKGGAIWWQKESVSSSVFGDSPSVLGKSSTVNSRL